MPTLTYTGKLTVLTCWCGMRHAVPAELREFQQRQHHDGSNNVTSIYCPLGHAHVPGGEGDAERFRRHLERERLRADAERDLRKDTERRLAAQKGVTTKLKKRVQAGVCPCCNRTFQQLSRHMQNKHPDYETTTP